MSAAQGRRAFQSGPALSAAADAPGSEGPADTFLTMRCLGRREWRGRGRRGSALFSTRLGPRAHNTITAAGRSEPVTT